MTMSPCSAPELLDLRLVARDERRRHEFGELRDEDLFRRVADMRRIVDDEGVRMDPFEKMRRRDVGQIEWRILAQKDDVHRRKVDAPRLAHGDVVAVDVAHLDGLGDRGDRPSRMRQPVRRVVQERVAARLRFEQHGEGRVARDLDALDRIHLDRDGEGHALAFLVLRGYRPLRSAWQPAE